MLPQKLPKHNHITPMEFTINSPFSLNTSFYPLNIVNLEHVMKNSQTTEFHTVMNFTDCWGYPADYYYDYPTCNDNSDKAMNSTMSPDKPCNGSNYFYHGA